MSRKMRDSPGAPLRGCLLGVTSSDNVKSMFSRYSFPGSRAVSLLNDIFFVPENPKSEKQLNLNSLPPTGPTAHNVPKTRTLCAFLAIFVHNVRDSGTL